MEHHLVCCRIPPWQKHNIPFAKRIHLRVASGKHVRALMHSEVIYAFGVERGLVSVGQLRTILGLHFVWEDCHPVFLYPCVEHRCRYLLIQSRVDHNLPLISHDAMETLLGAIQVAIEDGKRFFNSPLTPSVATPSAHRPAASNSSLSVTPNNFPSTTWM